MLPKDVDVAMGRATLKTRAKGVCFLTEDSHPCCLRFCVKEQRKLFPDLKRVVFFLFKSFRPIFFFFFCGVWLPRYSSRHLEYSLSLTFLLSVCLLMALNHSCLLNMRAQHQPNGIRSTASVISQLTWNSPNM